MNDDNSDKKLVNFLKQYRPDIPEAAPDLEQKLLAALEGDEVDRAQISRAESPLNLPEKRSGILSIPKWAFSPAIAASLLVFWSGYRLLVPAPTHPDELAHLEAFLIDNWDGVLSDDREGIAGDRSQTNWLNLSVNADTEPPTNN
ncbi:MAG: hypothetical protein HC941_23785 [Microcoleus sp. SU_5_3]|nr:hypothetical protein [Microcoleus sp. SU_5_3]